MTPLWSKGLPLDEAIHRYSVGEDPHGDPRNDPDARAQKSEFLKPDGAVVDVCGGAPCFADPS